MAFIQRTLPKLTENRIQHSTLLDTLILHSYWLPIMLLLFLRHLWSKFPYISPSLFLSSKNPKKFLKQSRLFWSPEKFQNLPQFLVNLTVGSERRTSSSIWQTVNALLKDLSSISHLKNFFIYMHIRECVFRQFFSRILQKNCFLFFSFSPKIWILSELSSSFFT